MAQYQGGATTIVEHRQFDSFGNMTLPPGHDPVDYLFAYTGRPLDPDTGVYNYRGRWYDPSVGRFLSEDPIGFTADDPNLYRYCGNSPMTNVDPMGTCYTGVADNSLSQYFASMMPNVSGLQSSQPATPGYSTAIMGPTWPGNTSSVTNVPRVDPPTLNTSPSPFVTPSMDTVASVGGRYHSVQVATPGLASPSSLGPAPISYQPLDSDPYGAVLRAQQDAERAMAFMCPTASVGVCGSQGGSYSSEMDTVNVYNGPQVGPVQGPSLGLTYYNREETFTNAMAPLEQHGPVVMGAGTNGGVRVLNGNTDPAVLQQRVESGEFFDPGRYRVNAPISYTSGADASPLDWLQSTLDVAGLWPAVGIMPDLLNTGISLARGNWGEASMNALAAVPLLGQWTKSAQLAYKGGRLLSKADEGADLLRYGSKLSDAPSARIHGNSLDYVGETHVYRIQGPEGTHKIGQSMQGVRVRDAASIRGEAQARALQRQTGQRFESEIRRTFPDKTSARQYETRLIERYRRMFGENTLPGNKTNR